MELAKVEQLLEAYFEGETSLSQEQELRAFFKEGHIPDHLEKYRTLFLGFDMARNDTLKKELIIPESKRRNRFWNLSIAASLLIAIGIGGYMFNQSSLTQEEQEALAAFKRTQETMMLLSKNLNKGTASMVHFNEFEKGSSAIKVLNQFTKSKELIIK